MLKKNYFLQIFFIFLSLFSLFKLYDNSINHDAWQYGEWLINYQNGFIRRGLIGEIIYIFSKLFNNNIQVTFFATISVFCLSYYFFSYKYLSTINLNFIHYTILFSPLFYLFFLVISKVGVKKELLLYLFYIFYLLNVSSRNFTFSKNWLFIFIYFILLINHELAFFYLPYLLIPVLFIIKKGDFKTSIYQLLTLTIGSLGILLLLYIFKGSIDHTLNICASLKDYAPMKCTWWGPIYALSHNLFININNEPNMFFYLSGDFKTNILFFTYIIYSFIPILIFFFFYNLDISQTLIKKKIFYFLILFCFVFSFPLFHVAEDWSRWFSIHVHLISFIILFLCKNNFCTITNTYLYNKTNNLLLSKNIKFYFLIFLFVFATSLHHHHFFFKGVKLEFTYYKIYKKFKDNLSPNHN